MPLVIFTDKEVASRFDCLSEVDVDVKTLAKVGDTFVPQYNGKLSKINRATAAGLVRRGSNLIALKTGATLEDAPATTAATVIPTPDPKPSGK
jgi:hypothetical protein